VLALASTSRHHFHLRGIVQGVGFRPYVWRLANELGLCGWVRNDGSGVDLEVEGEGAALAEFARRLPLEIPPLARLDAIDSKPVATQGEQAFLILDSAAGPVSTAIGVDTAPCPACLAELFDPAERRWRYPFINCTQCGPRYTISRRLPYDRANTSLTAFPLCPACAGEYRAPSDRRFHAEATACPVCGPQLRLLDSQGATLPGDPLQAALGLIRSGAIVAIKAVGGFQLCCEARNEAAVATLRQRKAREEKPLALLLANLAAVRTLASVDAAEAELLSSAERPIVLLKKLPSTDVQLPGIAPGVTWLGAMLPASPLHWLLFHEAAGRPSGTAWQEEAQQLALVATSANPGGEPLVTGNDEAVHRLAGIADAYLVHDRDIVVRCDDSVLRRAASGLQFIRRARGYTPTAIRLAQSGPSVLAVGGWFKNTICLTRGDEAFVSQHLGDLDNAPTCAALEEAAAHLCALLDVQPAIVAHDLHPDFFSSRFAAQFAAERGLPVVAVQHHHAHIAAILAEHRVTAPVLGLALDGVGLGDDGSAWGGELLRVDGATMHRLASLSPLPLPGGDRAAREPWRMAAAVLHRLGRGEEIATRFAEQPAAAPLREMLDRQLNCPLTSSLGRVFDAAAGLLGVRAVAAFEGQAAMLLEGLAERHGPVAPLAAGWSIEGDRLDLLPLLAALADEADAAYGAALFHATLAAALAELVAQAAARENIALVAGGGGCMLNAILAGDLRQRLTAQGLTLLEARQLPPNDGGLALGQAWVALQQARQTTINGEL
jgi:hydrogenase maturation protein HypF